MTNLVGTTLGQYQIVELIGEGGMASVYKAWQPSLRRYVALKVLAPHLADEAGFVKRFEHEAAAAANLRHTHIVTIHDVGTENGYHYIAMEFIEGTSLEERIRSGGAVAPEQVVEIISQIGSALDYAHQRGFIHRDIKPANVLVDAAGRAVLTDFGIAKAVSGSGIAGPPTRAGSIFGTPHYMSPEQVKEEPLDHRTDLYSLGIVCYEMLSGEVPFDATTTHSILYAQVHNAPAPLRGVNPAVPAPVEAVVNRMLVKEREGRYDSAGEFAMALAQAVAGVWPEEVGEATLVGAMVPTGAAVMETLPGGEVVTPTRRRAPARRRRWPLALGAAVALGVVLILGALVAAVVLRGRGDSLETRLAEAQAALADGRYEEAIGAFEAVLGKDADNVAALRGMGEAYEAQEQWQAASEWYEKWTQVVPDDPEVRLKLGWILYHDGDYELAAVQFKRVTGLRADWKEGWEGLGKAYYELASYREAVEVLGKWADLEPNQVDPYRLLTTSGISMGDHVLAEENGLRWAELVPDDAVAFRNLGWAYYGQGKHDEAVRAFEQAAKLDPNAPDTYRGLALSYRDKGDGAGSIPYFARWAELDPGSAAAFRGLGWAYHGQGEYELAVVAFRRAAELEPDVVGAYWGLGLSYSKLGDDESAAEAYQRWIALDPSDARPYQNLGWINYRWGSLDKAIEVFKKALKLEPDSASAHRGLGVCYTAQGNNAEALSHHVRWADLEPNNAEAQMAAGWAHFRVQQYEEARNRFAQAISLRADLAGAYAGLGWTYLQLGNCDRAVSSFETALGLDPENQPALDGLEECKE